MEAEGEWVGLLPGVGEGGGEVEVRVAGDEAVEEELVDVLGLGVDADAGIEVGGAGLDEKGDGGAGGGGVAAARDGEKGCEGEQERKGRALRHR